MKKLVLLTTAAFIFSVVVNAQTEVASIQKDKADAKKQESLLKKEVKANRKALRKMENTEVSSVARQQFNTDFGDIPNVKWERSANFDEATFTKDGKELKAFYDVDAKLVGTVEVKEFKDLPSKAQEFINRKYKDYTKVAVIYYNDNENNETDMLLYGQQFDDADNYFVELKKGNENIVLQVDPIGWVYFFKTL